MRAVYPRLIRHSLDNLWIYSQVEVTSINQNYVSSHVDLSMYFTCLCRTYLELTTIVITCFIRIFVS